ncbi:trafficking protein particle complex subunit 13-like isoform X1 [Daphnia pulex]|uniref:trafficking protein particle complex subunit 13-like isoform X1 n=1 Tax=Daphnia pulex TaxID=6669 RepID=UPI001EE14B61|nr:trafficking protein particle complex subunit 13-like isoform X1 [Daphnia pulex]
METKADQILSIKVMRLSRPVFTQPGLFHPEPWDLVSTILSQEENNVLIEDADQTLDKTFSPKFGLLLPQSFGTIYLGETFQSYLRVQNVGSCLVSNISIKADLQTAAQRLPLTKRNKVSINQLEPQQSTDDILSHEITEIGTHILVCEVSYQIGAGEQMTSSRYYKFQVLKPLDVKTKFYNAEDYYSDDVYLEAQIQNTTVDRPLCLDKVTMEPSTLFEVSSLNEISTTTGTPWSNMPQLFGKCVNVVQPGEIRQYLHCLKPKQNVRDNHRMLRGESNIGKLDLIWRTAIGDRGRLQTSQLQRMVPNYGDVRLTIQELPNPVKLHRPINFVCKITNTSERPVELSLVLEIRSKPTVLWTGVSNRPLKKIDPNHSTEVSLKLVPVMPGLQSISGLKLIDLFLKRTYDYPDIAQMLVIP